MKKLILSLIFIGGLATAGVVIYRNMHPPASDRLLVSGNIELTQVDIAFKTAGRLVERAVDEGDPVEKKMVVARLDRDQLVQQREAQVAALRTAEAQLAEARSAVDWQKETMAADLDARRSDLRSAETRLQELKNGARPQELSESAAAVDAAQAEYDRAKKDWDRAQALYKDDDISTAQFDQFHRVFLSADAQLKQVKEHDALVKAGTRSEEIDLAAAQESKARASLRMGEANSIELRRREQEITARQSEIARTQAQIRLIDTQLADTVAVSPVSGIVLVKSADPGEVLAPGTSVITVGDIDHPWLRAYIGERDLGRVKLGSKVKVTTDSFPGKVYDGRVSFISSEAEFTPKQIQTTEERVKLVYRIKIDIDNPHHELKSNMPADAEIQAGS